MSTLTISVSRCLAYLEKLPNAISGSGGHDATLRAAQAICRFGLSAADETACLDWFNKTKCTPTWSAPELAHKLEDARRLTARDGRAGMLADRRPVSRNDWRRRGFEPKPIPKFAPVLPPIEAEVVASAGNSAPVLATPTAQPNPEAVIASILQAQPFDAHAWADAMIRAGVPFGRDDTTLGGADDWRAWAKSGELPALAKDTDAEYWQSVCEQETEALAQAE